MDETTPPSRPDGEIDPRDPDPQDPRTAAEHPKPEPTSPQQALSAIRRVHDGADPTAEAFALSNEYTDRHLESVTKLWRRLRRGPRTRPSR